jgi:hypothetical protein
VNIDVRADMVGALTFLGAVESEHKSATVRGLNRAVESARAEAVRKLRPLYPGLKVSSIRNRIKLKFASRTTLMSQARFSGSRIPAFGNFGMRSVGRFGVRFGKLPYRLETPEGDLVDGAMLQRAFRNRLTATGRAAVLSRVGKDRMPITVLLAPALGQAVVEKQLLQALGTVGRERFMSEYNRAIQMIVARRRAA